MKVLIGMSGGLDSTYAAKKLIEDGYTVEGAVLLMHEYTETHLAKESADSIGIPLHIIDCRERFDRIVKENFVSEYSKGRTPNPCIVCNENVKFRVLYDYAMENGFDKIATGHYARIALRDNGALALALAEDSAKDQTYMLYRLPEQILSRLVFPLSEMNKYSVRTNAHEDGLLAADRPDSQEICFLPDGNHAEYIESVAGKFLPGNFIDEEGRVLGKHKGIIRYTVGQRKGLGISLGKRAFVTEINPTNNNITLSSAMSGKTQVEISDVVFSGVREFEVEKHTSYYAKVRYTAPLIKVTPKLIGNHKILLEFDRPVNAAPGQSAVVYLDSCIAFGGVIC